GTSAPSRSRSRTSARRRRRAWPTGADCPGAARQSDRAGPRDQAPKKAILATKPSANTRATLTRISASRTFALRCSGVIAFTASADHLGGRGVELGRLLEGVEGRRRRHLPFQAFRAVPWLLR